MGGVPNRIANILGGHGTRAWISLSGSVPGVLINSALAAIGIRQRKKRPILGNTLLTSNLIENTIASMYAWHAVAMTPSKLSYMGQRGNHDFASFAYNISNITPFSAQAIAITTASLFTLAAPSAALVAYLTEKKSTQKGKTTKITDEAALTYLLATQSKDASMVQALKVYPHKNHLRKALRDFFKIKNLKIDFSSKEYKDSLKALSGERDQLLRYLKGNIKKEQLSIAKKELLSTQQKRLLSFSSAHKALDAIASGATSFVHNSPHASKSILRHAEILAPKVGKVLGPAYLIFEAYNMVSSVRESVQALRCTSLEGYTFKAKSLTITKTALSIIGSVGCIIALTMPMTNILVLFALSLAHLVTNTVIDSLRKKEIQKHIHPESVKLSRFAKQHLTTFSC
jgi:hypothetical protein